jgi:hypothetical protein
MARKDTTWSDARIVELFQEMIEVFGPYKRKNWTSGRATADKRGFDLPKHDFDSMVSLMHRRLCRKWALEESGLDLPSLSGLELIYGSVTRHTLDSKSDKFRRCRAIALATGFMNEPDLKWLENLVNSRRKK